MAKALVLGSTGQVGTFILSNLRARPSSEVSSIEIIARRSPAAGSATSIPVNEIIEKDTSKWAGHVSSITPVPSMLLSGLATTRAQAGGFENQYKIDHDLNVEIATAAKAAGTRTYVLISSTGADTKSYFGYPKMKGEIEEHVKELGFEHTIILRPGLIVGQRETAGMAEVALRNIATGLGKVHGSLKDFWAQNADTIAKAAISAALKADRGEVKEKVWVLGQKEIVQLGLKEWKA